jgi:hypothetical protein
MKVVCHLKECNNPGSFGAVGFCEDCWAKLPEDLRKAALQGRGSSPLEEVEAVNKALIWLRGVS